MVITFVQMKKILVPTDFSKSANKALDFAIIFAKKTKARIILLHASHTTVISTNIPVDYSYVKIKNDKNEAMEKLMALQAKVLKSGIIKCDYISVEEFAIDAILSTIKKKKIDLVIMGTKGASGLKGMIFGSNTAVVIEKSTCPVLAVPETGALSEIKEIVYATDYHVNDLHSLKESVKIAKYFDSNITAVHVSGGDFIPPSEKELLKEFISKIGKKTNYKKMHYQIIYGKNVEEKLEHYAKNKSADLLVMSTHYRNLFTKLFGESITKKVAYHTKIPLLAFHYKKDPIIFT
jgi:nucleotide-binding universal stress UspA family protein